jgi:hypothetical protein
MNDPALEALIEKLKALSPGQLAQVEDFVDFLSVRGKKQRGFGPAALPRTGCGCRGNPPDVDGGYQRGGEGCGR